MLDPKRPILLIEDMDLSTITKSTSLRLSAKKLWENPEYRKRALANLIFKGKHQTEKIKEKYR